MVNVVDPTFYRLDVVIFCGTVGHSADALPLCAMAAVNWFVVPICFLLVGVRFYVPSGHQR